MQTFWFAPALVLYALAAAIFIAGRFVRITRAYRWATLLLGAGAVLQAVVLVARGFQAGNFPVANFAEALALLGWLTAVVGVVLIIRMRIAVIGAYTAATATIALGASAALAGGRAIAMPATLDSVWLPVHVTLAILGCAMFVLAASVSLVYLVSESRLKAKRPLARGPERPPSLEKLDRVNYSLLGWGFGLLSLAILTGALWAETSWGHFWSWEPVESWTLVIWILYAALIEARLAVGWRGRRAATLTIVVFVLLVGSVVSVALVFPGKHGGTFG